MSPASAAAITRTVQVAALGLALAGTVLSPAFQASAASASGAAPGSVIWAYSDEAIPGGGRPPSPGPTDPDGAS